ncbi:MAG: DUF4956 domain-containing protein [Chitinispirillia bacterium]|nr:DUF4956 domain-containing protein [Chitinispirillia bacterium]
MSLKTGMLKLFICVIVLCGFSALHFTASAFPIPMEAIYEDQASAANTADGDDDVDEAAPKKEKVKAPKADKAAASAQANTDNAPKKAGRFLDLHTMSVYFGENDWNFIGLMTLRFLINIFFAFILISLIYAKEYRIREFSFSFFVSNILIFMVTSMLASVRVRTGFAFGLFAILSILRYRTEQIQIREMTFLFAAIILGVINSLATAELTIFAVLWANVIICMLVYLCDKTFIGKSDQILLVYDNTKLLAKGRKQELHEDIKNRFGYDVVKVVITEMNYLTDSAKVKLIYKRQ